MNRRELLQTAAALPLATALSAFGPSPAAAASLSRVRPGDPGWPSQAAWDELGRKLGGELIAVRSPLAACVDDPSGPACDEVFRLLKNPYYLEDEVALTQSLGWVDAWTSQPSVYAVAARSTADAVAAIDFARTHNLRLVVKGGGHSYQGTSNAPDSLLAWTRKMDAIALHDAFVPAGCATPPEPAVSVEAGAIWGQVYDAVTTKSGRYVQGGGCLTVGVAGLIQSGGFGTFSKAFGLAAASLLEAEIVTADGAVRIANACQHPDLFWAIKGGGGGSFGVVTRVTLRTYALPETVGPVFATVRATSDAAYRRLVGYVLAFYRDALFNPRWGEQIRFQPDNVLSFSMLFQGLEEAEARAVWQPFFDWLAASPDDYRLDGDPVILAVPARSFWNPEFLRQMPGIVLFDDRPGAPAGNAFWAGNLGEAGQVLHGYQSAWLPAALLAPGRREALADALFAGSRHWPLTLHLNKGLAGAPDEAIAAARDTAMNPLVLDAFALVISGAEGAPAYPGIAGREPDVATALREAANIGRAMDEVRRVVPAVGSYVSEGDFFDETWRESYWGPNYRRLLEVKDTYDPDGLFIVHHGVGSERWSPDGFTRLA